MSNFNRPARGFNFPMQENPPRKEKMETPNPGKTENKIARAAEKRKAPTPNPSPSGQRL